MTIFADLPMKTMLTPAEVAKFFTVSTKTVYSWVESGELTASELSRSCMRIYRHSVIDFAEKRKNK